MNMSTPAQKLYTSVSLDYVVATLRRISRWGAQESAGAGTRYISVPFFVFNFNLDM